VKIDKTAPTVNVTRVPIPNGNGGNNTDVLVHFQATDSLSGVQGSASADLAFTQEGAGHGGSHTFFDVAGNSRLAVVNNVNIDKTAPEAFEQLDLANHDLLLFGRDPLPGVAGGAIPPVSVVPIGWGKDDDEPDGDCFDDHGDAELRT
jgi:hypothetical protein